MLLRASNRERFPRGLDKPRAINSVKDSLTAPQSVDFGYIQGAWRRIEAMRSSEADPVEPPTLSELEEGLGEAILKCDLFAKNWRNRIYRIQLARGGFVLGKQLVMGTKRLLLIEFVPGKTIEILAWTSEDVVPACELAGKILARLAAARTESIGPMPIEMINRDLDIAPWRLSFREKKILQMALERLAAAEVRIGHVYYDFKPANLIYQNNDSLFLVDAPDIWWRGVHLWDFACFRSSMRRHSWRINLRRPYDRHRRRIIRQSLVAFQQGYLTSFSNRYPEPPLFALAVRLFELQRNAVLTTMQDAKVTLAREKMPIARGKRLGNPLANRLTLPLLEIERRWLFQQLARELP